MSRVLVIGGTLFIGRHLVERLLNRGDDVTILHRGKCNPFGDSVRELHCDRNDTAAIVRILQEGSYEYVFDNVYDWQRGTTGEHVLAAADACGPELRRYVFVSSCAAYGDGLNLTEEAELASPHHPDPYCRNKADSERSLLALYADRGVPTTTLRPPFIYGPHNPFYREAFFWDRIVAGRPILIPDDGSRLMQFVGVSDLADSALLAADTSKAVGRAYNIGHPDPMRQDELVMLLGTVAGIAPKLHRVPRETIVALGGQVFEPPYYFGQNFDRPPITMDVTRASAELGFTPPTMLEGLRAAWDWYRGLSPDERPVADFSFDDKVLAETRPGSHS